MIPEPADPQSLNRYSYVRNNPLNRIDPTGNWDIWGGVSDFFGGVGDFFGSVGGFVSDHFISPVSSFFQNDFGYGMQRLGNAAREYLPSVIGDRVANVLDFLGGMSQGNAGTGTTLPEEFQGYESELQELGRRLRDSPFRQAERKGRALVGGQDVSGALRDSWIFGRTFDRVSWAREDQAFGDLNDRYNLVAFGRGIAEGAAGPNAVPNSLYDQSFLISHRVGRFVPGVFVNPAGDIVFFGQSRGDVESRICVPLGGGDGC